MALQSLERRSRGLMAAAAAAAFLQLLPARTRAGAQVVATEDFSLELGLRIQPRLEVERVVPGAGAAEWQRDFAVRRVRLKAGGKILDATYKVEWKIDGTDRIGSSPSAQVENGYIQWPLGAGIEVRAGLYDQPFSRDRLTSDSNQLAVDRGAVSNAPDALGLADNAVGAHVLGKIRGGRAEYALGLFDNRMIPGAFQDAPMVVGRLDLNFGSTQEIFRDTHFGEDSWCSLGVNGSYQGALADGNGADDGVNAAGGLDGMLDVPMGPGRLFLRGEVNTMKQERPGGGRSIDTVAWMAGLGYLFLGQRLQPIVRFDQVRLDDAAGGGTQDILHLGANLYRKGHSLKIQADVRLQAATGEPVDGARLQAQVDF